MKPSIADSWEILKELRIMKMQVDIYLTSNNQIQVLLQGPAQGAATFPDFDTFVRFIEGCQGFISKHTQVDNNSTSIPQAFLDAFRDKGNI
jgi:hypothetical protein